MKDELSGKIMAELVALRAKLTCFFDRKLIYKEQMLFDNNKHEFFMINKHNRVLHRDNDKKKNSDSRNNGTSKGIFRLIET